MGYFVTFFSALVLLELAITGINNVMKPFEYVFWTYAGPASILAVLALALYERRVNRRKELRRGTNLALPR